MDDTVDGSTVEHIPVLAGTLAGQINLPQDAVMVDATIGHGGHSWLFGQKLGPEGVLVGLDIDQNALRRAHLRLKDLACKVFFICANFSQISRLLQENAVEKADFILADLGLSSPQLADHNMGLSFQKDMPLDMRIDKRLKRTAADIVNKTGEKSLAALIYQFGEDKASRRIARFVVRERQKRAITTTGQLAKIVCKARQSGRHRQRARIHPATRTFQALRIVVNDELGNIERLLASAPAVLKKSGRIAIISFHSLEDRIVKNNFKENEKSGIYKIVTKKPLTPSALEINENPRARSAKLRIAQRL
ncbi:MAG: 16S rRNA (cytosine(1402)-N(4))-methyltransferase RsmH [Planctomycetota bacterium]|jgi:16S rRNA (cytosine1402-N4)-methyltransferase